MGAGGGGGWIPVLSTEHNTQRQTTRHRMHHSQECRTQLGATRRDATQHSTTHYRQRTHRTQKTQHNTTHNRHRKTQQTGCWTIHCTASSKRLIKCDYKKTTAPLARLCPPSAMQLPSHQVIESALCLLSSSQTADGADKLVCVLRGALRCSLYAVCGRDHHKSPVGTALELDWQWPRATSHGLDTRLCNLTHKHLHECGHGPCKCKRQNSPQHRHVLRRGGGLHPLKVCPLTHFTDVVTNVTTPPPQGNNTGKPPPTTTTTTTTTAAAAAAAHLVMHNFPCPPPKRVITPPPPPPKRPTGWFYDQFRGMIEPLLREKATPSQVIERRPLLCLPHLPKKTQPKSSKRIFRKPVFGAKMGFCTPTPTPSLGSGLID